MMSPEETAYTMSLGAVLAGGRDETGLPAAAVRLLDERDGQHLQQFGHLPGAAGCTLSARAEALPQAMIAARPALAAGQEQRSGLSGETWEVAAEINRRAAWANVTWLDDDPEKAKARAHVAQQIGALYAGDLARARIPRLP